LDWLWEQVAAGRMMAVVAVVAMAVGTMTDMCGWM
jgi:hypothetical protein